MHQFINEKYSDPYREMMAEERKQLQEDAAKAKAAQILKKYGGRGAKLTKAQADKLGKELSAAGLDELDWGPVKDQKTGEYVIEILKLGDGDEAANASSRDIARVGATSDKGWIVTEVAHKSTAAEIFGPESWVNKWFTALFYGHHKNIYAVTKEGEEPFALTVDPSGNIKISRAPFGVKDVVTPEEFENTTGFATK